VRAEKDDDINICVNVNKELNSKNGKENLRIEHGDIKF
jgi:hypothetical protein